MRPAPNELPGRFETGTQNHEAVPGVRLYGLADPHLLDERVPTFSFTLAGWHPRQVAEKLAEQNIFVWDGNYSTLAGCQAHIQTLI